jgi:trimethylamine---corrinoid protein Co-methyltransferase
MKPILSYLSEKEIRTIHQASLDLLDRVGMRFPSKTALKLLGRHGARCDSNSIVKFPSVLVEEALRLALKREEVILYGRDPECDLHFGDHDPVIACMTMATNVIDHLSGQRRPASSVDLKNLTLIADSLETVRINGGLVTPQDVPAQFNDWHTWAICLVNTRKHITGGFYGARCVADAVRMAEAIIGDREEFNARPFISGWVLTCPPLQIDEYSLDALMEMSRRKIPAMVSSGPIMGVTSPVTIAGTVAQAHAEILGCLVLSQLVNPGAPFVYTSFARGMDMKTANVTMASPEFAILKGALSQMGRFLGLPVRMPGMLRDSKALDAQAGFETAMVGATAIHNSDIIDAGQLDSDLLVDYADLVFCDECMGALKRLVRPLEVNENSLALDVISEIGYGGEFLGHMHTLKNFRKELWQPRIMERRSWSKYESAGAKSIREVALRRAVEILESHPGYLISSKAKREIDSLLGELTFIKIS